MCDTPLAAFERGWISAIHAPERCREFLQRLTGTPRFACVIGSTDTADIEGISAAGATPEKRRYTAALDAEYLLYQKPLSLPDVPRNPLGPPSPVLITRAALAALGVTALIVDAGSRVPPLTPTLTIEGKPGGSIETGAALKLAPNFKNTCRTAARMAAEGAPWAIFAESVPGGTTTALSVLQALGIDALGKVSSSMPGGNHQLKERVVKTALESAALPPAPSALEVAVAVGDPMQPALALMALESSLERPTVLGGGTQMAAVWALMARMLEEGEAGNPDNIALATTRWVAGDPAADLAGILAQVSPPVAAMSAELDFSTCRSAGLRRYEEGLVKEGVGAGAAAFAALACGVRSPEELNDDVELLLEEIDGPDKAI